MTLYSQKH